MNTNSMSANLRNAVLCTECDWTARAVQSQSQWRTAATACSRVDTEAGRAIRSISLYLGSSCLGPGSTSVSRRSRSQSMCMWGVSTGFVLDQGKPWVCLRRRRTPSSDTISPSAVSSTSFGMPSTSKRSASFVTSAEPKRREGQGIFERYASNAPSVWSSGAKMIWKLPCIF